VELAAIAAFNALSAERPLFVSAPSERTIIALRFSERLLSSSAAF